MKKMLTALFLLLIVTSAQAYTITLNWDYTAQGPYYHTAAKYSLYRNDGCYGEDFLFLGDIIEPTQTYTDATVPTGVAYTCYIIIITDPYGREIGSSNLLSIKLPEVNERSSNLSGTVQ